MAKTNYNSISFDFLFKFSCFIFVFDISRKASPGASCLVDRGRAAFTKGPDRDVPAEVITRLQQLMAGVQHPGGPAPGVIPISPREVSSATRGANRRMSGTRTRARAPGRAKQR